MSRKGDRIGREERLHSESDSADVCISRYEVVLPQVLNKGEKVVIEACLVGVGHPGKNVLATGTGALK
jgi:hypothetical protein